ncbi:MAG: ASKHA domain-containing protein [Thermoplasmata archaeon]
MPGKRRREGYAEPSGSGRIASVLFRPFGRCVRVPHGTDLVSAARLAGLSIGGVCGGVGTCGKCRIYMVKERKKREALACRTVARGRLVVEIPPSTLSSSARVLTEGVYVRVEPRPDVALVRRNGTWSLVSREKNEAHGLRKKPRKLCGIALDLGTTTLVASVFDLKSGERLAVGASLNPQTEMGEDIVTRIAFAMGEKGGERRLRESLLSEINALSARVCGTVGISVRELFDICAVGNTFMHHCLLGLPLNTLAEAPYAPAAREPRGLAAKELGVATHPLARAYVPPVVDGFLGSDAVAGALAAGLDRSEGPTLYIDLGTNGEVLLAFNGTVMGTTAAAGPAFEGAQIECGMRAADGAIVTVRLKGEGEEDLSGWGGRGQNIAGVPVSRTGASSRQGRRIGGRAGTGALLIETAGRAPPVGIAGSGLVDAVAALLDAGALDRRGALVDHPLVETGAWGKRVVLSRRPSIVYISQDDVRNLQLAKAAICAAAKVLLRRAGIPPSGLERILLAGAFGNYLDRRSALRIGLLPQVEEERILSLGNAASTGAGMMLLSTVERRRAEEIARRIRYVEMAGSVEFREEFVDSLGFP